MIRLLASVRDVDEALTAAAAGADFIDLKEPRAGALGGLPPTHIGPIVTALRRAHPGLPISATIGDHAARELQRIEALVMAVGECGVDYVKVGIAGDDPLAQQALLRQLAAAAWSVVPVFIADRGLPFAAVDAACELPFAALMADTEDKRVGSLFDCLPPVVLARFVTQARRAGKLVGLSGALRAHHVPSLGVLAPDFAGFRGALCDGGRSGTLVAEKLRQMRQALRVAGPIRGGAL
jgi:(5-formylfuran-3-yl)methyl phosphate synthase